MKLVQAETESTKYLIESLKESIDLLQKLRKGLDISRINDSNVAGVSTLCVTVEESFAKTELLSHIDDLIIEERQTIRDFEDYIESLRRLEK